MAKTPTPSTAVQAISACPDVRTEQFDDRQRELADWLHLDISASADVRTERAIQSYNAATQRMVEAGLLLASVRHDLGAEAFAAVLDQRGMARQRASELMRGAALVARLPAEQRAQVMALHQSKVNLLAGASAAVVEAALDDEEIDLDALSVRALRQRIRELEASTTDLQVQLETADAEAEALRKQARRAQRDRSDDVPLVVADMRAELMALGKKAALAIESFTGLGRDLDELVDALQDNEWADATRRLAVAQLAHLRLLLEGVLASYLQELPGGDATPAPRSALTKAEMLEAAKQFANLTAFHGYEADLREHLRSKEPGRGKGRPKAKPAEPELVA